MGEVYIKSEDVNRWISKYFPNKDLISIDDLIGVIEDLDSEVESLKIRIDDMELSKISGSTEYDDYEYEKATDK